MFSHNLFNREKIVTLWKDLDYSQNVGKTKFLLTNQVLKKVAQKHQKPYELIKIKTLDIFFVCEIYLICFTNGDSFFPKLYQTFC